jgi:hypothetical protein
VGVKAALIPPPAAQVRKMPRCVLRANLTPSSLQGERRHEAELAARTAAAASGGGARAASRRSKLEALGAVGATESRWTGLPVRRVQRDREAEGSRQEADSLGRKVTQ